MAKRFSIGLPVFFAIFLSNGVVADVRCREALVAARTSLSRHLKPSAFISEEATVFFSHLGHDGFIYLSKPSCKTSWSSYHQCVPNSYTRQGDPRFPIFLFGPDLAAELGFRINVVNGRIVYRTPGIDRFGSSIDALNVRLLERGRDPITYFPVRSSFLDAAQTLDFMLETKAPYLMAFPFHDNHPELTPHEVSFHYGAIVFPWKFLKRARAINQHTRDYTEFLRSRVLAKNPSSLPDFQRLIDRILQERSLEVDFGTGSTAGVIATDRARNLAYDNSMRSYSSIWTLMRPDRIRIVAEALNFLIRPAFQPLEAILARVHYITGLDISKWVRPYNETAFEVHVYDEYSFGAKISNFKHMKLLKKLTGEYVRRFESADEHYERYAPATAAKELMFGLDQRIAEILEVATTPRAQ